MWKHLMDLENTFGDQVLTGDNRRTENGSQNFGLRDWMAIVVIH